MIAQIEFCTGCGYYQKFAELSSELYKAFPTIEVRANHIPPRMKSFEITLDNKLIFSKLELDRFPEPNEIVELIKERKAYHHRLLMCSSVTIALSVMIALAAVCVKNRVYH